jgi:GNAT superfamily N-acetyltransferase
MVAGFGALLAIGWYRLLRAPFKKSEVLDLCLVGVIPEMQNSGLPAVLMDAITRAAIKNGVRYAESNPELEVNAKVQGLWSQFPAQQHKRFEDGN